MEKLIEGSTHSATDANSEERQGFDSAGEGIEIASVHVITGAQSDLSLLGLDSLLGLRLNLGVDPVEEAAVSPNSFPAFEDSDLPAPLFHEDDLPAPLFHDDDLPAPSLHNDDFPADLTTITLSNLLGLHLNGSGLPTVGEVVRTAYQNAAATQNSETDSADDEAREDVVEEQVEPPSDSNAVAAGDQHFIDPQSFVEQVTEATADQQLELVIQDLLEYLFDGFGTEGSHEGSLGSNKSSEPPPTGGSGGGNKVINGTAGDDNLMGSGADEILHGFAGDDYLDGAGGSDRLDGGQGNDVLVWDSADTSIDGKTGTDTLLVESGDADLTTFGGSISGIEIVDLQSDPGMNTLTLTAQHVLDATNSANTLTITGGANDFLDASNGWTDGGTDGFGNQIYTQTVGPDIATLVVAPVVNVNANILT